MYFMCSFTLVEDFGLGFCAAILGTSTLVAAVSLSYYVFFEACCLQLVGFGATASEKDNPKA
eukprot:5065871-Amphidinium_carterae.1